MNLNIVDISEQKKYIENDHQKHFLLNDDKIHEYLQFLEWESMEYRESMFIFP